MSRYIKPLYNYIKLKDDTIVDLSDYVIDTEKDVFVNFNTGKEIKLVDAVAGKMTREELL